MSNLINPFEFAVAGAATTFNPADSAPNIIYSGGNLTATYATSGVFGSDRATTSKSTGKWYWEVMSNGATISNGVGMGFGTATTPLNAYLSNTNGISYGDSGGVILNSFTIATGVGDWHINGHIAQCAVDLSAKLVWFRATFVTNWNNSGTANPATGVGGFSFSTVTGGAYFPMIYLLDDTIPDSVTANFGATAFSGTVPSGFSAWG